MENCLVCWESVSSRIFINLKVWKEFSVQEIIEKHLSWWNLRPQNEEDEPWICLDCWSELLAFHKFYVRVEKVNQARAPPPPPPKKLKLTSKIKKQKMEIIDSELEDTFFSSPKRKRTHKEENADTSDSKEIANFTIVDIEVDPNIYMPEIAMEDPFSNARNVGLQTNLITLDMNEFKNDLKGLINNEMKSLRRCIQSDISKLEEKLVVVPPIHLGGENFKNISEYKDILNIHDPFSELETFFAFDLQLRADKDFLDSWRELMSIKTKSKNLTDAIAGIVSMVITPELQMKFSACGKPHKGVAKENFSATNIYSEMKDFILSQFPSETEGAILSKTSRWLAQAKDRHMGRSNR